MKLFEPQVMIIILAIVLIIFGPKQLPELGKMIGQTLRAFRTSMEGDDKPNVASTPLPTPPDDNLPAA